jgi:hypothetical protein
MAAITTSISDALVTSLNSRDDVAAERLERRTNRVQTAFRLISEVLFNPYRPERHYMRGPGPAWRRKHGMSRTAD